MSYLPDLHRQLPQSLDAEKGVLGSILLAPDKVMAICLQQKLTPDWFHSPHHGQIFKSLLEMKEAGKPVDLISLTQFLEDHKVLDQCGGAACVTELFTFVPTASNVAYYVEILREKYALRLAIADCTRLGAEFYEGTDSLQEVYDKTTKAFIEVREVCAAPDDDKDYDKRAMVAFLNEMEDATEGRNQPDLFQTGFPTIDRECGGMTRGEVLLIRGRKGCGKSLLGQAVIQHNVLGSKRAAAAIFTFEMPHSQVMRRLVASHGRVSLKSMRDGKYEKRELDSFRKSMTEIMASKLKIYDTNRIGKASPVSIFSAIRKLHRNEGVDMVMVDHLNLLVLSKKKESEKRTDELLHDFSAELKALCLELKICGVLLAQENTEGGTFGATQVETDVDDSVSLIPIFKTINNIKRIVGTSGFFIDKWREGDLLGRQVPVTLDGKFASIYEAEEAVRVEDF